MKVDITGLSKEDVLLALYNGCTYVASSSDQPLIKVTTDDAKTPIKEHHDKFGNYKFSGVNLGAGFRELHVDLDDDIGFDSSNYNFLHGEGRAEQVIADLRKTLASRPEAAAAAPPAEAAAAAFRPEAAACATGQWSGESLGVEERKVCEMLEKKQLT